MNKVQLGSTGFMVSPLCLGTVNYGSSFPEKEAFCQLDSFCDKGGNFIDTAHVYGDWGGEPNSKSERVIGRWLKSRDNRDKIILASKGAHPRLETMNVWRMSNAEVEQDLNESLEYLQTDYIDLYFLHRDDLSVPVDVILDYLESQVKLGKIRHYGCSNWTLARVKEAQDYCNKMGYQGFSSNQIMSCLADVNQPVLDANQMKILDKEFRAYHEETQLSMMSYMAISQGYFQQKARGGHHSKFQIELYENTVNDKITNKLKEICTEAYSITDMALHYALSQKFPAVPIVAFSKEEQMVECFASCDKQIPIDIMDSLTGLKEN